MAARLPFYDGAWHVKPFISDTVDMPDIEATITFNEFYEFDVLLAYIDMCVALGYVKSDEVDIDRDKRKALSAVNPTIYRCGWGQGFDTLERADYHQFSELALSSLFTKLRAKTKADLLSHYQLRTDKTYLSSS